jgi:hypothetical protein
MNLPTKDGMVIESMRMFMLGRSKVDAMIVLCELLDMADKLEKGKK